MEEKKTTTAAREPQESVTLSGDELRAYRTWQAQRHTRSVLDDYNSLVDDAIADIVPAFREASDSLRELKASVLETFRMVIRMKREELGLKKEGGQKSHTFTNSDSTARVTLGVYVTDGYRDTVQEGIEMVQDYVSSLISDEGSKRLANMLLGLLARDGSGNLSSKKVVKLRQYAKDYDDPRLSRGVEIIEESYLPSVSKMYVKVETRSSRDGAWVTVPSSITEVPLEEDPSELITGVSQDEESEKA